MKFPDVEVVKRLFVGKGNPTNVLGVGPTEVRGSAYIEGPQVVGNPLLFKPTPFESGTVMCGPSANTDLKVVPFYSLMVNTFARIKSFLKVDTFLCVRNIKSEIILTKVLQAKVKNFIIDHPTKEGKKLVHSCLEGPENAVYVRGRITDKNIIELPEYWTNLIDYDTITVEEKQKIRGEIVGATDMSSGLALILGGLICYDKTIIGNIEAIDKGCEKIDEKFKKLGADIIRN